MSSELRSPRASGNIFNGPSASHPLLYVRDAVSETWPCEPRESVILVGIHALSLGAHVCSSAMIKDASLHLNGSHLVPSLVKSRNDVAQVTDDTQWESLRRNSGTHPVLDYRPQPPS